MTILEKNSAIFSKIGKVYLLNWDFSANWEFFKPIGKKFGTENRTQFCIEKKPCTHRSPSSSGVRACFTSDKTRRLALGSIGL